MSCYASSHLFQGVVILCCKIFFATKNKSFLSDMAFIFQSNYIYTDTAKKMRDKYSVVLDTPGYRTVQELKTHLSEVSSILFLSIFGSYNYIKLRSSHCFFINM